MTHARTVVPRMSSALEFRELPPGPMATLALRGTLRQEKVKRDCGPLEHPNEEGGVVEAGAFESSGTQCLAPLLHVLITWMRLDRHWRPVLPREC